MSKSLADGELTSSLSGISFCGGVLREVSSVGGAVTVGGRCVGWGVGESCREAVFVGATGTFVGAAVAVGITVVGVGVDGAGVVGVVRMSTSRAADWLPRSSSTPMIIVAATITPSTMRI